MNKDTIKEIEKLNDIPDAVIQKDIDDTQKEIEQYQAEIDVLSKNPVENKIQIYLRQGRILKGKSFVKRLEEILECRKQKRSSKPESKVPTKGGYYWYNSVPASVFFDDMCGSWQYKTIGMNMARSITETQSENWGSKIEVPK